MKYIVLEIQENADGSIGIPPVASYASVYDAESKYHTVLSAAAKSQVAVHSAVMLNSEGQYIKSEAYDHRQPDSQED